jgi:Beta-lactamase enzyme family
MRVAIAAGIVALALVPAAEARYGDSWRARVAEAIRFADDRAGVESVAVVDESGRMHGYRRAHTVRIASLLKPMLLVAYLSRMSVRDRELTERERRLLTSMIRWSDDGSAEIVLGIVGSKRLNRVARRAGMTHFRFRAHWGWSDTTAADQARFFYRIDSYVPARHRSYVRYLLRSIVASQRWGIPVEAPSGWTVFFKGGWSTGTGRVTHQVALLEKGRRRLSVAILTEHNPSHDYGVRTIRGLASRLLLAPLPGPTPSG